jgi:hypothetical protein
MKFLWCTPHTMIYHPVIFSHMKMIYFCRKNSEGLNNLFFVYKCLESSEKYAKMLFNLLVIRWICTKFITA